MPSVSIFRNADCDRECKAYALTVNLALCIKVFLVSSFIDLLIKFLTFIVNFLKKHACCNLERKFILKKLIQLSA